MAAQVSIIVSLADYIKRRMTYITRDGSCPPLHLPNVWSVSHQTLGANLIEDQWVWSISTILPQNRSLLIKNKMIRTVFTQIAVNPCFAFLLYVWIQCLRWWETGVTDKTLFIWKWTQSELCNSLKKSCDIDLHMEQWEAATKCPVRFVSSRYAESFEVQTGTAGCSSLQRQDAKR